MIKKYVLYVDIDEETKDVNIDGFECASIDDYDALITELIWQYRDV